jgi:hypothetical protein
VTLKSKMLDSLMELVKINYIIRRICKRLRRTFLTRSTFNTIISSCLQAVLSFTVQISIPLLNLTKFSAQLDVGSNDNEPGA